METYAKNFIRVSVISLVLGFGLGLLMTSQASMMAFRPIHVHLLLLGFMSMMVFGVGYHIIPRFQGHAIIPWAWATLHFYIAPLGLSAMLLGWYFRGKGNPHDWLLYLGGGMEFLGVLIFLFVMFRGLVPVKKGA